MLTEVELNGGLSRLHSADEDTVSWLTNFQSFALRMFVCPVMMFLLFCLHSTV